MKAGPRDHETAEKEGVLRISIVLREPHRQQGGDVTSDHFLKQVKNSASYE